MLLEELRLQNLRCFEHEHLSLSPGWNLFVGDNGVGKTTVLEGAYLLSHGHSFRGGSRHAVQREGSDGFSVFGRFRSDSGSEVRAGLARIHGALQARVDGQAVGVGELVRHCAVVCFEPGSHELVTGASALRRRFVDWGVFHVEPQFLEHWRRFQRALKQRNALLRQGASTAEFEPWHREMAASGNVIQAQRFQYVEQLKAHLLTTLAALLPELGAVDVALLSGWSDAVALEVELIGRLERDRERGHTTRGPHRADLAISFANAASRDHLSRGQGKLLALSCLLAQARLYADHHAGRWPVFCIDDLASELDQVHQRAVVGMLSMTTAQVLVTGTERSVALDELRQAPAMFHVEPAGIHRLL